MMVNRGNSDTDKLPQLLLREFFIPRKLDITNQGQLFDNKSEDLGSLNLCQLSRDICETAKGKNATHRLVDILKTHLIPWFDRCRCQNSGCFYTAISFNQDIGDVKTLCTH